MRKGVHHFDLTTMRMSLYFLTVFVSKVPIDPSVPTELEVEKMWPMV